MFEQRSNIKLWKSYPDVDQVIRIRSPDLNQRRSVLSECSRLCCSARCL